MTDPHCGAKNILKDVPFDETELTNLKGILLDSSITRESCEHEPDVTDCVICYDPERIVQIQLNFEYMAMKKNVKCELIFETTCKAIVNTIMIKEHCGKSKDHCDGNSFALSEGGYFWCKEHLGDYNELRLSDIFINSDFDVGLIPLSLLKTGDRTVKLLEVIFNESD